MKISLLNGGAREWAEIGWGGKWAFLVEKLTCVEAQRGEQLEGVKQFKRSQGGGENQGGEEHLKTTFIDFVCVINMHVAFILFQEHLSEFCQY
jgi:hypothetical protein